MSEEEQRFVDDCRNHGDLEYVLAHLDDLPDAFRGIYEDPNGEAIVQAGVGLFAYLADLVVHDFAAGMEAWGVVYMGYPNHQYTDLFTPFFDVTRTQLLWYNVDKKLIAPDVVKAEIFVNIYLRWNIAAVELARKLLVFAAWCRGRTNGQPFTLERQLYKTRDIGKTLSGWGPTDRAAAVLQFYNQDMRHAIAHGNLVVAFPRLMALHVANDERSAMKRKLYEIGPDGTNSDVDRMVADLQEHADPLYQSARIFFMLFMAAQNTNMPALKSYLTHWFADPVLAAMVQLIGQDPTGLRDWS